MIRRKYVARSGAVTLGTLALVVASACSLGTEAGDKPSSVRVRVEGTSSHQLTLVTAEDFYDYYDLATDRHIAVAAASDTTLITLPYDQTLDISRTGSVYVELRNVSVDSATVRFRVELNNGQRYDRTATLADSSALVYYYVYTEYSYW